MDHFNLDVIISVGYRVKSLRGAWFRQWATHTLRDHLVRGYTLNERRLVEGGLREARETLRPPDRQESTTRTVLEQAEALSAGTANKEWPWSSLPET